MNRRTMIAGLSALPFIYSRAEALEPYRVSLIGGGSDGGAWQAGVVIDLDKDWKTYWRMPGEAGIPPSFDWKKSNGIAGVDVLYPLPQRLHDASGETIGYAGRVVFPLIVKPAADAREASLDLDLFFAVCKEICIPAEARASLALGSMSGGDFQLLEAWRKRVPAGGSVVQSAHIAMDGELPVLVVKLARPAIDIFVETATSAYFRRPAFSNDGLEARLVVDNVKDPEKLRGLELKLTVAMNGSGIEQTVTLA